MSSRGRATLVRNNPWLAELLAERGHFRSAACPCPVANSLADTSVGESPSVDPVTPGAPLTFTILVTNSGPFAATSVILSDPLPSTLSFVSVTPGSPTCTYSAPTVSCSWSNLASGASKNVTITTNVSPSATGSISNTVTVASSESDPDGANNAATSTVAVNTLYPGSTPSDASAGAPLMVQKNGGNPANLDFSWGAACGTSSTGFALYEGALGSFYSHVVFAGICNLNAYSASNLVPSANARYYLVVPVSSAQTEEGSYGASSFGERPASTAPCFPVHDTHACP